MFVITPYSKHKLKATDLAVFPWEKEESKLEVVTEIPERFKKIAASMDADAKKQGII